MLFFISLTNTVRSYAIANAGIKPIWDAGNHLFRLQIDQYPELQTKIIGGMLNAIENMRYTQIVYVMTNLY